MKPFGRNRFILAVCLLSLSFSIFFLSRQQTEAATTMPDYCIVPPFVSQSVPPLVMLETGRDHKFYYEAYNDAFDLDEDDRLDRTYKHTINYYGYYDPNKCYTYSSSGLGQFTPVSVTSDKFCSAGQWSGNVMNWLTMMRMDVLKKVLYGGDRVTDTLSQTVLQRVVIPGDAHSSGKELTGRLCYDGTTHLYTYACTRDSDCNSSETCEDKSNNLLGIAAATAPHDCSVTAAITWTTQNSPNGRVRISRYLHSSSLSDDAQCGEDTVTPNDPVVKHNNLIISFEPETASNFIDTFLVNDFNDARLDPASDHYNNYNILGVADFRVSTTGTWQFLVDSDDPAEVEIGVAPATATGPYTGGQLVAAYYGCHSKCFTGLPVDPLTLCDANQSGSINLGSTGWYRIIVRHSERTGQDGAKVWYKKPGATSWTIFPSGLQTSSTITRTPDVASGSECIIESNQYVQYGIPQLGVAGRQHLFCNTQLNPYSTGTVVNQMPTLRMATNSQYRKWQWASKENPVCQGTVQQGTSEVAMDSAIVDRTVRVEVCKSSAGLESNCRAYKDNASTTTYKPAGLLQRYGEGDGTKVCSKTYTKTCTNNICGTTGCCVDTEGFCIDKSQMYFGLMSTSYTKNTSGGVLRKKFNSLSDEINRYGGVSTNPLNGIFDTSATNGIINTFENFSGTVGYRFSDWTYQDATGGPCGWITSGPIAEGNCREWGNPIGEMMYESLRYLAGTGSATAVFDTPSPDSGLSLPHPSWGYAEGCASPPCQPYQVMPSCARPFMLVLSDENTSFDDDQLPGVYSGFGSVTPGAPLTQLNVSTLADVIGTGEGIAGHNWFIGRSGSTNDFICSSKAVTNLSSIEGLCPMEPTKRGSYYSAAVAYYGKTKMNEDTTKPNASTYVVALTSPLADLRIKAGSNIVSVVPLGKSISGDSAVRTNCYNRCTPASSTYTVAAGLRLGTCASNAFCPTNQIVKLYVDDIRYDSGNNVVYASYRINFEDVEQGADHDMDAVVQYEICTAAAVTNNYGSCGTDSIGSGQIEVKVSNVYGKGGIDQVLGFVISGTTADGTYLVIKDGDVSAADTGTPALVAGMPLSWSKIFTTTGTTAEILKSPLWYAAKWGGFDDADGDNKPFTDSTCGTASPNAKCAEWDKDKDGVPDNYFLVVNPLKLEEQLDKALLSILRRASSGTAASVLASGEGSGANLVQAVFYPKRLFDNKEIAWSGTLQNLWYYVDPLLSSSSIRENTVEDDPSAKDLIIDQDYIANFFFDESDQKTKAKLYASNADGVKGALQTTVLLEELKYLWEAGSLLHSRDLGTDPRTIYTTTDGSTLTSNFTTGNASTFQSLLQASDLTNAQNIISYVRGESDISASYRDRTVTNGTTTNQIWKLGDIVSSTPRVVSWVGFGLDYDKRYDDLTYSSFLNSDNYKYRGKVISGTPYGNGMVFTGANDGMLHAFNLGSLEVVNDNTSKKATLRGADMGREEWAFIAKNSLPYLKYLMDKDYCHLFFIDASPYIFDASINIPSGCIGDYWNCTKDVSSWRTILIGGMRVGGACRAVSSTYGVQAPTADVGYSSYFALDLTDTLAHPGDLVNHPPQLLWEFSRPAATERDLGFTTTGPAIVRINAREEVSGVSIPKTDKNGRWFVVFASGPTGPIDTVKHEFKGYSDQNLKLFILDLKTGALATPPIDTGITNAFGSSINGASMDYDLDYQDDAFYIGYTKAEYTPVDANTKWTSGGVLRVITRENLNGTNVSVTGNTALNPGNWLVSDVITGIGPVTSSIGHLAHYPTKSKTPDDGWLYFGTGRYFFRSDDISTARTIFGVKELCLSKIRAIDELGDPVCGSSDDFSGVGDLDNVTINVPTTESPNGWYINLDPAERVITDPLASTVGAVFFTTFAPSSDICEYGGSTYLWAVKHDTGGTVASSLKGTALIQVSTGVIEEIDLRTAFTEKKAISRDTGLEEATGRRTGAMQGVPPIGQGLSIITQPPPVKRTIHIRER